MTFHDLFNQSNQELKEYIKSQTIDSCMFKSPNEEEEINVICASFENFKRFYSNMEKGVSNAELIQLPLFQIVKSTNSNTNNLTDINNDKVLTIESYSNIDSIEHCQNYDDFQINQQRAAKQRKSESDVQANGVFLKQSSSSTATAASNNSNKINTNNGKSMNTNLNVNQSKSANDSIFNTSNLNTSIKAQPFSPILSIKSKSIITHSLLLCLFFFN
jgi:hypothetical protein